MSAKVQGTQINTEDEAKSKWYIGSGCSCHFTGNPSLLLSLQAKDGGSVSFGDKKQGKIKVSGSLHLTNAIQVRNDNLVDSLKFNLLSVAQLCDQGGNKVTFSTTS